MLNSEIDALQRKRVGMVHTLGLSADEAKRLQTTVGNFDREIEAVKENPQMVKGLQDRSQAFRSRLSSLQPTIDSFTSQIAAIDAQIKTLEGEAR